LTNTTDELQAVEDETRAIANPTANAGRADCSGEVRGLTSNEAVVTYHLQVETPLHRDDGQCA
jgi:hypothetical protein